MSTPAPKPQDAAVNDIALDHDNTGTRFVTLVVVLMTVLATMAVGGALVVQSMRASWVGAVTGHMTIEIPAAGPQGDIRDAGALAAIAQGIGTTLAASGDVKSLRVLPRAEVERMVQPWLGRGMEQADLPLPALIAVTLDNPRDKTAPERVARAVASTDASAVTETHQGWLADLKRFSLALLMAALLMAGATMACCILTVTGAVRARLAAHQADIDLLHLMGATDDYIAAQFVRVVVRNVGQAALVGGVAGYAFLKLAGLLGGGLQASILPSFAWGPMTMVWLAACPVLITALSWWAARFTVLRTLSVMP